MKIQHVVDGKINPPSLNHRLGAPLEGPLKTSGVTRMAFLPCRAVAMVMPRRSRSSLSGTLILQPSDWKSERILKRVGGQSSGREQRGRDVGRGLAYLAGSIERSFASSSGSVEKLSTMRQRTNMYE